MKQGLQDEMFSDLETGQLFETAKSFGLEYVDQVLNKPVFPTEEALADLTQFDEDLPDQSGEARETLSRLHTYGAPNTTAQIGGRYFGFVHGGIVPVGLAAKILASFWDQNASVFVSSPIASKLETIVQSWLVHLFGLPDQTVAGFVSGTSMANFCALAAARYRLLMNQGWDVVKKGLYDAPKIRLVTGREAHSSMLQAISLAGFGTENIEWVDVDDQGRILADQIPELDSSTILSLQAGNVNSGAFDDFAAICKKAKAQEAWIHVDGAFGLWAGATSRMRHLTAGYEHADSWAADAHKTLNAPYDSGIFLCVDEAALIAALHINAAYLPEDDKRNGMYYTPEMSRRSRVIELWATLRYLGRDGIDQLVYGFHTRAALFAELLNDETGFEVLNDVVYNQVLVRCQTDDLTEAVLHEIQALRVCWVGGSIWHGRKVIRISVCSWATTEEDVHKSVASFQQALINVN